MQPFLWEGGRRKGRFCEIPNSDLLCIFLIATCICTEILEIARASPLFFPWSDSEGTEGVVGGSESFTCHSDGERESESPLGFLLCLCRHVYSIFGCTVLEFFFFLIAL